MEVLRFDPLYQERPWGGRLIETFLGRKLPSSSRIGESWEIVDRTEAQSVVRNGRHAGSTLRELIESHGAEIMGPRWSAAKRFPILVKWLDCHERLSLQVHPMKAAVADFGGEPKTENWFVARAEKGAALFVGLQPGVTRARFERALAEGRVESCLRRLAVNAGDSLLVPSGTLHAIDAGNFILEIQQNSDTTYRVHDWGRVGLDGEQRKLHLRESLASMQWNHAEPRLQRATAAPAVLADCPEFRIRRIPLIRGERLAFSAHEQPRLLHLVSGHVREQGSGVTLEYGDNVLLPQSGGFVFSSLVDSLLLITENFT